MVSDVNRRTWVRVRFGYQFQAEVRTASGLPRYKPSGAPDIFVVSLPQATERRESIQSQLKSQNIPFTWWDAVDGTKPISTLTDVRWYFSGRRRRDYLKSKPGSHIHRKVACDLSHIRLMHGMLSTDRELQVVLEDDAQLLDQVDFLRSLNLTLAALPEDWEALYLNHGTPIQDNPSNLLGWVGPGVRMFLDNAATVAIVYRRSFALKTVNDVQIGNKDIDNVMNDLVQLGRVKAYVADPPLVRVHEAAFASQIEVPT